MLIAWLSGFLWIVITCSLPPSAVAEEVSSFQEWYALPSETLAQGHPVRIDGVVLCYDAAWGQLYLHDHQQTAYFSPASFPISLIPGQAVTLTGSTAISIEGGASLRDLQISILGESTLPPAQPLALSQLHQSPGGWVEVEGRVRVIDTSRSRLGLLLQDRGHRYLVYVLGDSPPDHADDLLGAKVRVRGINSSRIADGQLQQASLFAPSRSEITLLERPQPPAILPQVTSIGTLLGRNLGPWTNQPVHLSGLVASYLPGQRIDLEDPTGFIRATVIQETPVQSGQRVQLQGFLEITQDEAILQDPEIRVGHWVEVSGQVEPGGFAPQLMTSAGLGGVLLLALAWVALLRREVNLRTRQLSEEILSHKNTTARLQAEAVRRAEVERMALVMRLERIDSAIPRMPLSGVRISWLMLARKQLLARLAASAASRLASSSAVRTRTAVSKASTFRRA